jgi:hypothetical protein
MLKSILTFLFPKTIASIKQDAIDQQSEYSYQQWLIKEEADRMWMSQSVHDFVNKTEVEQINKTK